MVHVVSFSTGLSSALMTERVIQRYGKKAVKIVFMDTLQEDSDNYRFAGELKKRWKGVEFITITEGRNPYEVFSQENIIPNSLIAPCTFRLKIQPFTKWLKEQLKHGEVTVHIGYSVEELHRCEATKKNYEKLGAQVDFPLLWQPIDYRPFSEVCRNDLKIEPPIMYQQGYSHANCGGLCVKQGQGDWIRTLVTRPEAYAMAESWETQMRERETNRGYAILKEVKNGTTSPLTLRELRERYQSKNAGQFDFTEVNCIHCGAGDIVDLQAVMVKEI